MGGASARLATIAKMARSIVVQNCRSSTALPMARSIPGCRQSAPSAAHGSALRMRTVSPAAAGQHLPRQARLRQGPQLPGAELGLVARLRQVVDQGVVELIWGGIFEGGEAGIWIYQQLAQGSQVYPNPHVSPRW